MVSIKPTIVAFQQIKLHLHCVKSFQIGNFLVCICIWSVWSVFSCIRNEYGDFPSKFPYSVQIEENTDQKKTAYLDIIHAVLSKELASKLVKN